MFSFDSVFFFFYYYYYFAVSHQSQTADADAHSAGTKRLCVIPERMHLPFKIIKLANPVSTLFCQQPGRLLLCCLSTYKRVVFEVPQCFVLFFSKLSELSPNDLKYYACTFGGVTENIRSPQFSVLCGYSSPFLHLWFEAGSFGSFDLR